ncbi:MAG TPA: bifunctional diguanylate cyclase/phosphodiesterase [Pseudoxanthomonas sp.]|nr:bifunctional diguanylate cyclase/phosphodiesterase [Pseudoxanthomonas sp.]
MKGWWLSRTGKTLLLGALCVAAQQVAIRYRIDFFGSSANASLIHLHAGLLLAIALLETDRRVVLGCIGLTALGWATRQWVMEPQHWPPLLWGTAAWVATGAWILACAQWAGWPRDPGRRRIDRRGLGRLVVVGLFVFPAGWALLGGTILVIEQPAVAISSIFQMFFAKQFGVAVVTLPLMVAWTEREPQNPPRSTGLAGWGWPLALIAGLGVSLWSSQAVHAGLASPAVVLMDYRFALFVVLAWFVLRLPPKRSMLALSAALFCLVYAVSGSAEVGNTGLGLINLFHLTLEVDILLLAMLYLWVISRDRRDLSQRLGEESLRDTITGLPNLRALRLRMRNAPPQRGELGFLLLDQADTLLTGFGLDTQASVMEAMAARLSDLADVYYLGTGQFGLVPLQNSDDDIWERLVVRVEHAEFHAEDQPVRLLPYLGVASLSASPADTVDAALLTASHLAFDARQHGEVLPRYSDLNDDRLRESHRQQMSDAALALSCLRNERLVLYFQPIRRRASADEVDSTISGEVLCRLRDDEGRLIPPARFMRPIEAAGRGAELDLAVIRALFRQLRRYPGALPYCERIAINLTGQSLASMSFQIELRTLLADSPLPLSALCFEVTETAAISSTAVASRLLRDLRARGCQVAIDDFGTGMQSFARLKELPVDIIKIDGSFIRNVAQRGSDYALVQATVAVAGVFGAETVAEFVEDRITAECLRELDVDWVQGDLYSPPRPLSEVLANVLPREMSFG